MKISCNFIHSCSGQNACGIYGTSRRICVWNVWNYSQNISYFFLPLGGGGGGVAYQTFTNYAKNNNVSSLAQK